MKKILLTLLIGFIGLIGFGNCYTIEGDFTNAGGSYYTDFGYIGVPYKLEIGSSISPSYSGSCYITTTLSSNRQIKIKHTYSSNASSLGGTNSSTSNYNLKNSTPVTINFNGEGYLRYFTISNSSSQNASYSLHYVCNIDIGYTPSYNCPSCPTCEEQYTSDQCQQEYSLMPISSCNTEYCGLNGLCPEYTGSTMSELYINGISHISAPIINFTIPMDIAWDYELTGSYFNLVVTGNNGDQEYIDGLINVNSYRPTSEDFTQTFVGGLTLIFPYIIITAMILFLWRFIKKIFK